MSEGFSVDAQPDTGKHVVAGCPGATHMPVNDKHQRHLIVVKRRQQCTVKCSSLLLPSKSYSAGP